MYSNMYTKGKWDASLIMVTLLSSPINKNEDTSCKQMRNQQNGITPMDI